MEWAELAQRQAGVIGSAQLIALGWSERRVSRAVSTGVLTRSVAGVFLVRGAPFTFDAQLWTAVLSTGGILGFDSAAALWKMADRPSLIHVIVGPDRRVARRPAIRRHHVFVPSSAVTSIDGLPVTSRVWTLLDHLGRLPSAAAVRLADRALQQEWMTHRDMAARLADYPGRQGNTTLRRVLSATSDGAAAESERRLHRLLRRAGITAWRANYRVMSGGVLVALVDVAFVAARVAIEVDGHAYHSDVDRFRHDRRRQNALVALGWTVLRYTWHDLEHRAEEVIAEIAEILNDSGRSAS